MGCANMFVRKFAFQLLAGLMLVAFLSSAYAVSAQAGNEPGLTATQWIKIGIDYHDNKKDYDNAIAAYSKAIELNPQEVRAYFNRGNTYKLRGQYDLAMADYKAIELNPQEARIYIGRGLVFAAKGQYDLAIVDYNKAIELKPQGELEVLVYNNRGLSYVAKRQYDLAIVDYNKAVELNPQHAKAYNNRGIAYGAKGQFDLAMADYNKAIELNPQEARFYYNKANACRKTGNNSEAIQAYKLFLQYTLPSSSNNPYIETAKRQIRELGGVI